MPEHDLEPPKFSRRALERILNDWTAVKSMLMSGKRQQRGNNPDEVFLEQLYLESQSGTARLDKFTHCLLVKCSVEVGFVAYLCFLLISSSDRFVGSPSVIFLPNDKILVLPNLKASAYNKLIVTKIMISFFEGVENIVGKGEDACYKHI